MCRIFASVFAVSLFGHYEFSRYLIVSFFLEEKAHTAGVDVYINEAHSF